MKIGEKMIDFLILNHIFMFQNFLNDFSYGSVEHTQLFEYLEEVEEDFALWFLCNDKPIIKGL